MRQLLTVIFDDGDIARRFRIAPAAKNVHHAYLGGLVEHVLSMCSLARATAPLYRDVDLDLLLAGVLLHDIGKVYELSYDRAFGYSTGRAADGSAAHECCLSRRIRARGRRSPRTLMLGQAWML